MEQSDGIGDGGGVKRGRGGFRLNLPRKHFGWISMRNPSPPEGPNRKQTHENIENDANEKWFGHARPLGRRRC